MVSCVPILLFILLGINYKWEFDKWGFAALAAILELLAVVPLILLNLGLDAGFPIGAIINLGVFFGWNLLLGFLFKLALSSHSEVS